MEYAFHYANNMLFCEGINLVDFAQGVKTPFYIYSRSEIEKNCHTVINAGKHLDFLPCYALKANYNPALLTVIRQMGFGADVVSGGELLFALKAGFPPGKIVFAGVGKTEEEIELALRSNIHSLNIESADELETTASIAAGLKRKTTIAIRVNPDIDAKTHAYISTGMHTNKFGISVDEAMTLYRRAAENPYLEPKGVHVHIGSQITEVDPYLKTVDFLLQFIESLRSQNIIIEYLDLGGGVGIDYHPDYRHPDKSRDYLNHMLPEYLNRLKSLNLKIIVELGRSIIGSSGLLVSKVLYRKQTPRKKFVIVDAAMNNLIRPSLYSAYHQLFPLQLSKRPKEIVDVVGPVCETGDFLAKDRELSVLHRNEYLAVSGAGAYGQALSSRYNLRPTIAEYLVAGRDVKTIHEQEKIEDIMNLYEW